MKLFTWIFSPKYRMFSRKAKDVQASIWEMDFKVFKARQLRETSRLARDRAIEAIQQVQAQVNRETDEVKKASLQKEIEAFQHNVKSYEGQMKMIDEQIDGVKPTAPSEANPAGDPGTQGINDLIAGLASLREMYKDYQGNI